MIPTIGKPNRTGTDFHPGWIHPDRALALSVGRASASTTTVGRVSARRTERGDGSAPLRLRPEQPDGLRPGHAKENSFSGATGRPSGHPESSPGGASPVGEGHGPSRRTTATRGGQIGLLSYHPPVRSAVARVSSRQGFGLVSRRLPGFDPSGEPSGPTVSRVLLSGGFGRRRGNGTNRTCGASAPSGLTGRWMT